MLVSGRVVSLQLYLAMFFLQQKQRFFFACFVASIAQFLYDSVWPDVLGSRNNKVSFLQGGPLLYSCKWSYGAPINGLINGVITLLIGVIVLLTGMGPTLSSYFSIGWFNHHLYDIPLHAAGFAIGRCGVGDLLRAQG